jgi:hypothetical protein
MMEELIIRLTKKQAQQVLTWAKDERDMWPDDTAYADDLDAVISQLEALLVSPA